MARNSNHGNLGLTPFCRTIVVNSTYVVGQFVPQTGIISQLLYEILKDIDLKLLASEPKEERQKGFGASLGNHSWLVPVGRIVLHFLRVFFARKKVQKRRANTVRREEICGKLRS